MRKKMRRGRRRGATIVEAALVGPVAILTIIGGIDIGRIYMIQHTIDGVAYEAAQAAMVPGATEESVREEAMSYLRLFNIRDSEIQFTSDHFGASAQKVAVRIIVPVPSNVLLLRSVNRALVAKCTVSSDRVESYRRTEALVDLTRF